jgi:NitT/TauT family transport system substrate-binding protein
MSHESDEVRGVTSESEPEGSMTRRSFLGTLAGSAVIAGAPFVITHPAHAQAMRTIRFSEAVHNLGYIDLYVARAKGFF